MAIQHNCFSEPRKVWGGGWNYRREERRRVNRWSDGVPGKWRKGVLQSRPWTPEATLRPRLEPWIWPFTSLTSGLWLINVIMATENVSTKHEQVIFSNSGQSVWFKIYNWFSHRNWLWDQKCWQHLCTDFSTRMLPTQVILSTLHNLVFLILFLLPIFCNVWVYCRT